jgi:hypothetical protein
MADEPEVPRHEELMEFGKADGGGRRWGRDSRASADPPAGLDDRADAPSAFEQPGRALPVGDERAATDPWMATRGWVHRLDRSRSLVIVAVCIGVTALNVGFVGWATRDRTDDSGTAASAETHGLSEDQAACFAFARIESRVSAIIGTAQHDVDNLERSTLKSEIDLLDRLASDYPSADYRLMVGFHEVADASVRFIASRFTEHSRDLSSQRLLILNAARDLCVDVAHFDTRAAQPAT